jgi:hypothetical protein
MTLKNARPRFFVKNAARAPLRTSLPPTIAGTDAGIDRNTLPGMGADT